MMDCIEGCIQVAENEGLYVTGEGARKEVEYLKNFVRVAKLVMEWVDNWNPDFTEDPEWEDTEAQWKYALMTLDERK